MSSHGWRAEAGSMIGHKPRNLRERGHKPQKSKIDQFFAQIYPTAKPRLKRRSKPNKFNKLEFLAFAVGLQAITNNEKSYRNLGEG
jgi:hypothetical protein